MEWDFFLAHGSADDAVAAQLRSLLEPEARVFEDSMLQVGEDWAAGLDSHLRASAITVVMLSEESASSHYLREEIARAIALASSDPGRRVAPLYLEPVENLPYGLAIQNSLWLSADLDLAGAARKLLESLRDLRRPRREGPAEAAVGIGLLLADLDYQALQGGDNDILRAALEEVGRSPALVLHLKRRGLDRRMLLPWLPGHAEARARWLTGSENVPGAGGFPDVVRRHLVRRLDDGTAELGRSAAAMLREHLTAQTERLPAGRLANALTRALPPLRSTSTEAVLVSEAGTVPDVVGTAPRAPIHLYAAKQTRLPPPESQFAGRKELVTGLAERIVATRAERGAATAFVTGQLGVGVSTFAIETARALTDDFPGGVLYIDLRGMDESARRDQTDVAKLLCYSLGESPTPGSEYENYRMALTGRGVLVLLDNAFDEKHVASLVPAPPTCAVIVTSRARTQWFADRELVIHVPPLHRETSVQLLSELSGRSGADPVALHQIAEACADLPMALRLISTWMTNHPEISVRSVARQVTNEKSRLAYLEHGVVPMRLAIELSYRHLDQDAQKVFRFLPAVPGSAATAVDLGRGLALEPEVTEPVLYRLVDRSVASCEDSAGEYLPLFRLFELVRLYALELLDEQEPPDVVARFRQLLVTRLRDEIGASQGRDPALLLDPTPIVAARDLAEREQWLDLAADLTDALEGLHEAQSDTEAVRRDRRHAAGLRARGNDFAGAARGYVAAARDLDAEEAEELFRLAEEAAQRTGDPSLMGEVAFELAKHRETHADLAGALAAGERSADWLLKAQRRAAAVTVGVNNTRLALRLSDRDRARRCINGTRLLVDHRTPSNLRANVAYEQARSVDDPLPHWREAMVLYEQIDNFASAGLAAYFGGWTALDSSATAEAAELFLAAAHLQRKAGDVNREAWAVVGLSAAYATIAQYERARDLLTEPIARFPADKLWHASGVLGELALRAVVLGWLEDGVAGALPELPKDPQDKAERLLRVVTALQHPHQEKRQLEEFAASPMVYEPPAHKSWIHRDLMEELPDRPQLR
ncbi:TIR domain-containing protein [Amycolatopsis sp. lyj-23]|uniref:TIR domain-containing protein n=1 Tax=Amycolatopsis sp. lyj-23 TaxID=2789283 RepID=UPI00397C9A34